MRGTSGVKFYDLYLKAAVEAAVIHDCANCHGDWYDVITDMDE